MATVSIILRTDKVKKDGTVPLNFLIIKDRKKTKIATKISIDPKHWDEKNSRIKPGATNSARNNATLKDKWAEIENEVLNLESTDKTITARGLKNKVNGLPPTNFFTFTLQTLADYNAQKMFGTHDKAKSIINKIETFNGSKNLFLQDITTGFLSKYETYCRTEWENKTNTIHKDMKFIRKVYNDAIRLDLIEFQKNPFLKYKLKVEKTQRTFLTEDELTKISKVVCTKGTRLELHRDMFVFAAYAGGLRVSDVLQLKWKNLDKSHINITIKKTGNQISIKAPDKALEIINKYKPKKVIPNNYIFSMLPNGLNEDDLRLLDNAISSATAYINKNLKTLAEKAKIQKTISFHISRHTFATRALKKGISIDKISKLMGHAQIKETQIYAKIVNEELDKAMDVFNI